jgi:hypothetical protein
MAALAAVTPAESPRYFPLLCLLEQQAARKRRVREEPVAKVAVVLRCYTPLTSR